MLRTWLILIQILFSVVGALVGAAARRLRHGPMVRGWSWEVELKAVALRAFIMAAAAHPDPNARRTLESRFDPPLPRRLRDVLRREETTLGGRPAEWLIRQGSDLVDSATLLYFHGGAYVAGSRATHRDFCARLTWAAHTRTVVVDYRLADEAQFPAAVDDAQAAYEDLLAEGVDSSRVIVGGDSAGGGLASALLLRLRARGLPLPAGAVLFSPYTDLEHTGASILRNVETDYLPFGEVRANVEYLGDADPQDPEASPMYGDFTGIPPLLVFAGGREMILDDSVRLVENARRDGVDVSFHVEEDMYHVWPALLPTHPATLRALALTAEFVRDVVSARTPDGQ